MEEISIASSLVSLVLAILAIWLSVVFYRMSNESSNKIHEASKDVGASVTRLEKLFDRLYSDTFNMMKDTVTDMRHQLWPDRKDQSGITQEVEKKADEKIQQIRDEVDREIATLTQRVGGTNERIADLRIELQSLVDGAIAKTRHVESEAEEETLRKVLFDKYVELAGSGKVVTADPSWQR